MPTNINKSKIHFGRAAPTISVSDINKAIHFYVDVLGMEKKFENGDPIGFVILKKDQAELHLTLSRTHKATDRNVVHMLVDDAQALHDHLERHNIRIIKGIRDADYDIRGFIFADPDGNRIDIGQKIEVDHD